jgi:hypothetical protein
LVRQRTVPQLLSCSAAGSAYLRNWISATGTRPEYAIPTARPMIPSSESEVSNTRRSPKRFCSPSVTRCTPPFTPTSSPNDDELGVDLELARERAPHGLGEAQRGAALGRPRRCRPGRALGVGDPAHASLSPGRGGSATTKRVTRAGSLTGRARAAASAASTSPATSASSAAHSASSITCASRSSRSRGSGSRASSAAIASGVRYAFWLSGPSGWRGAAP